MKKKSFEEALSRFEAGRSFSHRQRSWYEVGQRGGDGNYKTSEGRWGGSVSK